MLHGSDVSGLYASIIVAVLLILVSALLLSLAGYKLPAEWIRHFECLLSTEALTKD